MMLYGELPTITTKDGGGSVSGYPCEILNPHKTCLMRLPTSEEVLARMNKQYTITQDLGRGKQLSTTPDTPDADALLFTAIRLDKGEDFDPFETAKALSKVTFCRVIEREREGNEFKVQLECYGGIITTHTLTGPSEKAMHDYRDSIVITKQLGRSKQELRFRHESALALYDANIKQASGYLENTEVPAHHKFTIALELAAAVDELDPVLDPNS